MRKARMALVLAAAGGLWFGCSNSTGPAPTLAGTWHVSVGTLTAGTISPSSFDVVVTASGDSFLATIPTLTWSVGPVAYDTLASVEVVFDSNMVFLERPATSSRTCDFVLMGGNANTARDTIHSAIFDVLDTDMTGAYICKPKAIGSASVHK